MILKRIKNCEPLTKQELRVCLNNISNFVDSALMCYPKPRKSKPTLKDHMLIQIKYFLFELKYTFPIEIIKGV